VHFETKVLSHLMGRLGFPKQYFLEKLMKEASPKYTQTKYSEDEYTRQQFLKSKAHYGCHCPEQKMEKFIASLNCLNKEFKKQPSLKASDFGVVFLDMLDALFPQVLISEKSNLMWRQSYVMMFCRLLAILIKHQVVSDESFFAKALVSKAIFVLRYCVSQKDLVEMAIVSLQIIFNSIGVSSSAMYLDLMLSLVVQAYLNFKDDPKGKKIKGYTAKILHFYLISKIAVTKGKFIDCQFLFLNALKKEECFQKILLEVEATLYSSEDQIRAALISHCASLKMQNEDLKILSVEYLLEIMEADSSNSIRKILIQPDTLKVVYQSILELSQKYKTENNRKLSVVCARCIACIGLCHPFVNDPLLLKASNQKTAIQNDFEEEGNFKLKRND